MNMYTIVFLKLWSENQKFSNGVSYNSLKASRLINSQPVFKQVQFKESLLSRINNNSVVLVRERTIPSERLQLVGEVSANF
jgi:hypothetical protein